MVSAILLDFNGVIVDDEPQHCASLIATLEEDGIELDRDTYYRDYLGFDDRECFRFTFERLGRRVDEQALADAIERKHTHYARLLRGDLRLVPGAADFVESAALEAHQLAIVSGALRREIELVLDLAGLRPHFAAIVAAEDVTACKPDPGGYRKGLEVLDVPPSRAVVIEDSLPGVAAAHAAGIRCVMLATSHDEAACAGAGADAVWRDLVGRSPADLPWPHA